MRGAVRAFLGVKPALAALRDGQLDGTLIAALDENGHPCLVQRNKPHHDELVRRGLAGDPELERAAKKFRPAPFRPEAW